MRLAPPSSTALLSATSGSPSAPLVVIVTIYMIICIVISIVITIIIIVSIVLYMHVIDFVFISFMNSISTICYYYDYQ